MLKTLVGKRFGKGVVVRQVDKPTHVTKPGRYWLLGCDCGGSYTALTESLNSGNSHSCGCTKHRKGKDHPNFKGHGEISHDYWQKLNHGASRRNITFKITIEEAWQLFLAQGRKCDLTGWEITLCKPQTASLDRIDSKKPYVKGNVQWVHKDVNRAKQHYTEEYFRCICKAVIEHNGGPNEA